MPDTTKPIPPADAFWLPRLWCEWQSALLEPDSSGLAAMRDTTRGATALMGMAVDPMQWLNLGSELVNLAASHAFRLQAGWMGAWSALLPRPPEAAAAPADDVSVGTGVDAVLAL